MMSTQTEPNLRFDKVRHGKNFRVGTSVAYTVVCGRLVRAPKARAQVREGECDLSEASLLAAWTKADEHMRALTAELERHDAADAFARESTYVPVRTARPNVNAEYAAYLHSQYLAACDATHSYMVCAAGVRKGYQSSDFFKVGRRPSVERWGSDESRAWLGSVNAAQGDVTAMGEVLSKTEYARLAVQRRPEAA